MISNYNLKRTTRRLTNLALFLIFLNSFKGTAQTDFVNTATGNWSALVQLDNFDPNDDQQSNADTDFVGNANYAIMETQKQTVSFNDGITDEVYYFRVRMGQSNPSTSFYFGLDVSGDFIADLFIEANVKSQTPFVSFHLRDYAKTGLSPSQTSWLNGTQNNELALTSRNAVISDYSAGTDIDGGNSGTDYWLEFAFTEEILKAYVLDNFNLSISGDSAVALHSFTSTSQTSNGDVMGVDDTISGILDLTWVELGLVINGTLNNITSGAIVTPTVVAQTTDNSLPTLTGTWGSSMLGDDSLSVTVNGVEHTTANGLVIDNLNWSLALVEALSPNTYGVAAKASRSSSGKTRSDTTDNELIITAAVAQDIPFNCDYNAYLFQYSDVYSIDLASGSSFLVAEAIVSGSINATGYNPSDGFIWGYLSEPSQSIVRIGKDFSTDIFTIPELPTGNKYVGDINSAGIYYFRSSGSSYYSVDLNPNSASYLQYLGAQTLSQGISIHDWAFNSVDNKLYTVEKNTNKLYRITPETGALEDLGEVPILAGLSYTYGAVYFDASGNFYVSANESGAVYIINEVHNISTTGFSSNIFAYGPASASNDGARCPTAPVLQEDCANGVDDDGDGLVDCDDPACSGVKECPVTYTTSSADTGGLESNDRLAERIGRRNYQRAKEGYVFNTATAKRVKKGASYMKKSRTAKNNIELASLVPLGVINESEIVESSASDLLDLTNASDLYSVDYLKDDIPIGALMVIKTEDKVYEHSKFICDRFLGAELLSVTTIQLREKNFIKSIIKQPDGSQEFALTFSARETSDNQFVVESHWNIDAFEKDALYYNFQIWSSSIENLLSLGEEVLRLLEVNSPISAYEASAPPPVFVKSAKYQNGMVSMKLINNNYSDTVLLEGAIKRTETSQSEGYSTTSAIDGYLSSMNVETGDLFDLGFRISDDKGSTPDDLFVADAPWGLDDSAETSSAEVYKVLPNDLSYMGDGYRIERNVHLKGVTSEYIGVYRALSPRFAAVDLSEYNNFVLEASGTGALAVNLLKGNGASFSAQITLTSETTTYELNPNDFVSGELVNTDFSDLKVISFELRSENGQATEKEMLLENIEFTNQEASSGFIMPDTSKALVMPNPLVTATKLYFYEDAAASYTFEMFTVNGSKINSHRLEGDSVKGQNEIEIFRKGLGSGIYFYNLTSTSDKNWSGRIMVN